VTEVPSLKRGGYASGGHDEQDHETAAGTRHPPTTVTFVLLPSLASQQITQTVVIQHRPPHPLSTRQLATVTRLSAQVSDIRWIFGQYYRPPELAGAPVTVRVRLGSLHLDIATTGGHVPGRSGVPVVVARTPCPPSDTATGDEERPDRNA
jgi:hypothetical protein